LQKALHEVYEKGYFNYDCAQFNPARLIGRANREGQIDITPKEKQFLILACSELTYKQIAVEMNLSERTVDGYRESLFRKFGVQSRVGLCLEALRKGYVDL
jgi:DNA-binding CsgD family transcriptional regulator